MYENTMSGFAFQNTGYGYLLHLDPCPYRSICHIFQIAEVEFFKPLDWLKTYF